MKRLFVLLRYFTLVLALVVLGFAPRTVLAHMGETRPSIEGQDRPLEPPPGERGKAVLLDPPSLRIEPKNGQFLATFRVKNEGPGALRVYRVGWPQAWPQVRPPCPAPLPAGHSGPCVMQPQHHPPWDRGQPRPWPVPTGQAVLSGDATHPCPPPWRCRR